MTGNNSYKEKATGQRFELAFLLPTKDEVDSIYEEIVKKGATPIMGPHDMPWGQKTALFADPDGNIHEASNILRNFIEDIYPFLIKYL